MTEMRSVRATRYVTPLREGGSLPGLFEADDDGMYVVKFRGAGQGPRVLVAEWLAGEIARALGLLVPDLVAVDLEAGIADSEPHQEIHDLLVASVGWNIGLDFLPGSMTFNPVVDATPDPDWAASVVWLDGLVTNPDRSPRNPNLLVWHGRPWLIDHGAALYLQHGGLDPTAHAQRPFALIADHVLLARAASIAEADRRLRPRLGEDVIQEVVRLVPPEWFARADPPHVYVEYLSRRLAAGGFAEEAERARIAG